MTERKLTDGLPDGLAKFAESVGDNPALYGVVTIIDDEATFEGESLISRQEVSLKFKPLMAGDPRTEMAHGWIKKIAEEKLKVLIWINQAGGDEPDGVTPVQLRLAVYHTNLEIEEVSFRVVLY